MIADIEKDNEGILVKWERKTNQPVEAVWAMLSDNNRLEKWFDELRAGDLRKGGFMKFYIPDVMDEKLEIMDFKPNSVLEFDWFGDVIRFELHPENDGVHDNFIGKSEDNNRANKKRSCRLACLFRCYHRFTRW